MFDQIKGTSFSLHFDSLEHRDTWKAECDKLYNYVKNRDVYISLIKVLASPRGILPAADTIRKIIN